MSQRSTTSLPTQQLPFRKLDGVAALAQGIAVCGASIGTLAATFYAHPLVCARLDRGAPICLAGAMAQRARRHDGRHAGINDVLLSSP
jgi:hypothetical protein